MGDGGRSGKASVSHVRWPMTQNDAKHSTEVTIAAAERLRQVHLLEAAFRRLRAHYKVRHAATTENLNRHCRT